MRVQLESLQNGVTIWTGPIKPGQIVWVSERAARHLLENGICRFIDWQEQPEAGPTVTPEAGPSEIKEAVAPKSAAAQTAGHLIDLQSLRRSGPGILSSASAAALVSPKRI